MINGFPSVTAGNGRPYKCIFFDLDHTLWDYECNARETLQELHAAHSLQERGVGCGIYYPRTVFDYACYHDNPRVVVEHVPVAESVARRCLSLPVHHHLGEAELDEIISAVREVMKG